jgi:hypothetical protein
MSFNVSITRFSQYVQLAVSGPASMRNFVELVGKVGQETMLWSDRWVLVDLCGVEGGLTPTEQVFLGEMVAQDLPHLERVASVVPPERITHNSETAAQELGMRLRVFASRDEAQEWLTAPTAAATGRTSARATH